jgi:hypothetical protein
MGIRDLSLQIVDHFLDTLKNIGQRLNGGLGGVWKRRVYFGQLEQFLDAADSLAAANEDASSLKTFTGAARLLAVRELDSGL